MLGMVGEAPPLAEKGLYVAYALQSFYASWLDDANAYPSMRRTLEREG